jgi:hypothetical protein
LTSLIAECSIPASGLGGSDGGVAGLAVGLDSVSSGSVRELA